MEIEAGTGEQPVQLETAAPSQDTPELLDIGQFGDKLVEITVDGETQTVPLSEAASGYMRQSAFTRKTQDLANQRKELEPYISVAEAFERDPEAATLALANYYGFNPNAGQRQVPQDDGWGHEEDEVDPRDAEIQELKRQMKALATNQSAQYIDKEAHQLVERYPGVDPEEVKRHALANNMPNLEVAARDLLFDERNDAWESLRSKREADAKVIEQKKQAGVVSPGSGPALDSVNAPTKDYRKMSFEDTFKEVLAEQNKTLADIS